MDDKVHDQPSEIDAEDGIVIMRGPGEVQLRFTPDAADETSERLSTGSMKARGQRYFNDPLR